jgi:hypothetical protein
MSEFREKIKTLKSQFPVILSEYKRNYDLYSKDKKDQTKLSVYNTSNSQVAKCIRDMTDITTALKAQNNEFVGIMRQLNRLIIGEQKKNALLKRKLNKMNNVNNGSATLIDDYKENYNETNMRNWAMFIGILVVCISSLKTFIIPTSVEGLLLIKTKKLEDAKKLLEDLQGFAKDLNDKRRDNDIKEKIRQENEEYNKEYNKRRAAARAQIDAANAAKFP